jgi:hypothetical protein
MLANFDTKNPQRSQPFSFEKTSRDTDVSNPPCSSSQSKQNEVSPKAEQTNEGPTNGGGGGWRRDR